MSKTIRWGHNALQLELGVAEDNAVRLSLPGGGTVSFGFKATWSASDADPTAFWFNGPSCAIG